MESNAGSSSSTCATCELKPHLEEDIMVPASLGRLEVITAFERCLYEYLHNQLTLQQPLKNG